MWCLPPRSKSWPPLSENTSRRLLEAVRRGQMPGPDEIRLLGEESPVEFFRDLVEPLCDSFDPAEAEAYQWIMSAFFPPVPKVAPSLPETVETVYVLSRVTL